MKGGPPVYVMEFDTAPVSFEQFVLVLLTNTGQNETYATLILTPTSGIPGDVQAVDVDLLPGATTETVFNPVDSKFGNTSWLSIRSGSDQVVPTVSFVNFDNTEGARYLPGDFAIFNLIGGRTRIG